MSYWIVPITFALGGLAGGLLAWTWRGRSDAVTRRQKIKLVAATAFLTVALLSITGYAVLRYRFGNTGVDRASTGQAVSDFRKAGGTAHRAGTPPGGVYTFRAHGGMTVHSALLGDTKRTLPSTIPAVLIPRKQKPGCWELTLRLYKQNHRGEVYCKDATGLRLEQRWERNEMFGIKTFTRQGVTPTLLVGPERAPGTKFTMAWKILEHKTTMPLPVKRPDLSIQATYVALETLTIGGKPVRAHHLRQHATYGGAVTGTLNREVWYAADTGMMLQLRIKSAGKGVANVTIDSAYTLTSLQPKQ